MRRILAVLLGASFLMFGGGLLLLGVPGQAVQAIIEPTAPSDTPEPSDSPTPGSCVTGPQWLALTSKHKETAYAFGNPVEAREWDSVLSAMRAYAYKDPAGAAALTAAFDGRYGSVNNRTANYIDPEGGHEMWCQEVDRMMDIATSASFSIKKVDAGVWSLYMVKAKDDTGPKVEIRQGQTTESGTAAVFEFDGRTVELRLDCHFQPVGKSEFPSVPHVPSGSTPSPTTSPTPTHEATTPAPSQSLTPKDTGTSNGEYREWGDDGAGAHVGNDSKPKSTTTPSPRATAKPVQTSSSSNSGSSGSTSSTPSPTPSKEGGNGVAGGDTGGF